MAVIGRGVVPADSPVLRADDLGVLRGDGVFETMHVRRGEPWLLTEHLDRMAGSAARLDLALPERDDLAALVRDACAAWQAEHPDEPEAVLRVVCTRGPEGGGPVTAYATVGDVGAVIHTARRDGVRLATATLGVTADARTPAPWLLGGVKSLSYAVNMTSSRWAVQHGYDDVLWVSADGYALESPTASLIWLEGGTLYTVPTTTGILPGITGRQVLSCVGELGWHAAERMVRPTELEQVAGVWLTSSVRGIVEVRELDGRKLAEPAHTAQLRSLIGYPG